MAANPIFPGSITSKAARILPADTTTLVTLWTPGVNGSKLTAINGSTDDTAAHDVQLWVTVAGVDYLIGTKTVAITAGFIVGTIPVNWLDGTAWPWLPIDADGQRYLLLAPGMVLKGKSLVTVTAAKTLYWFMQGADF